MKITIDAGEARAWNMDYHNAKIAALYDLANPLEADGKFYLSLAGKRARRVLDLGCGTGTLCCALAKLGHKVTGIDPAAAMLAVARSKPGSDQIEWVESSAQTYRSDQRFDLILMTGHAFQLLLSDSDTLAVLETMRHHLTGDGRVAFESRNPLIDWAGEWNARCRTFCGGEIKETLKITAVNGNLVSFETSQQLSKTTLTTSSTLRFPSHEHIHSLIDRSGLTVKNTFGDWNGSPFDPARSREMIFIAQL